MNSYFTELEHFMYCLSVTYVVGVVSIENMNQMFKKHLRNVLGLMWKVLRNIQAQCRFFRINKRVPRYPLAIRSAIRYHNALKTGCVQPVKLNQSKDKNMVDRAPPGFVVVYASAV